MSDASVLLEARDMQIAEGMPAVNLTVRAREIIGLAGLEGQGQELFLEALCGLHKPLKGDVIAHTSPHQKPNTIKGLHSAVRSGIVYLPRNRKSQGILPALSVLDNFSIATLGRASFLGFLNKRRQHRQLEKYRERLSIVYASPSARISSLSGGNQQKVLLSRWLASDPRIMLLNDPTRGVDLSTRLKLYDVFKEVVKHENTAMVILSTEIEELLQLCDRVLIFRDFHVFTELDRSEMTMSSMISAMFGNTDDHS